MGATANSEHHINLSTIDMFDVGDVPLGATLESAHLTLQSRVHALLSAGPHVIPFVVGGSNDQSYPNAAALMQTFGHGNVSQHRTCN